MGGSVRRCVARSIAIRAAVTWHQHDEYAEPEIDGVT